MASPSASDVDFDVDGTFIESRDGRFVCLLCAFESADKTTVTSHVDVVHSSNWFKCDVARCTFAAATKRALNRHKASEHLQQLQMTSFTRAAPSVDSSMIYDQETGGLQGHGSGMWQCHICPDKTLYRYRRSYEKHMAKHKGYVEPSIEAQSHREYALATMTSDPATLTCFICGAHGFEERTDLQAHLLHAHSLDGSDPPPLPSSASNDTFNAHQPTPAVPTLPAAEDLTQEQLDMIRQVTMNMMQPHRNLMTSALDVTSSVSRAVSSSVTSREEADEQLSREHRDIDAARDESPVSSRTTTTITHPATSSSNGTSRRQSRNNRKSFPRRLTTESADDDSDEDGSCERSAIDRMTSRATSSSKRLKLK